MQFKGIITKAMPIATGTSKAGKEWKRASFVLTYDNSNEQYPKSVLFDVMGDRIEQLNIQLGKTYEVEIDFSTREFNGRVYMSASAWKAIEITVQTPPIVPQQQGWEQVFTQQKQAPKQAQPQADNTEAPLPF